MRLEIDRDRFSVLHPVPRPGFQLDPQHLADNHIMGFEQASERAQPFVALRAELLKHARATNQHVFAVTSVQPGNGKTHVAVNLAAALSRITPTVLIDLDLRRPSIAARLGLPAPALGLDDCLAGNAHWAEVDVRVEDFDLRVYPTRRPHDAAEGLIGSPHLMAMLDTLRASETPPICIVDTSPIIIDDDFSRIAHAIDGALMVVEEGRTAGRAVGDALRRMRPVPVVGTILNKSIAPPGGSADYSAYYRRKPVGSSWFDRILGRGTAQ